MLKPFSFLFLVFFVLTISHDAVGSPDQPGAKEIVDQVIEPLMREYNIPGVAVAVAIDGRSEFFNYGVASKETRRPVTSETLFELGSISKTFTGTLAAYAALNGDLSWADNASKYFPSLRGSSFDRVSLLNLATHTTGGLPMQVPENIKTADELMDYFKRWQPPYAAGTHRTYSNPGIGLLGMVTAESMHRPFEELMEKMLFPALGMTRSYIDVPRDQTARYAQGYTVEDLPIRVSHGVLAAETYGIKSCSSDLIRYVVANLQPATPGYGATDERWQRAITSTHTGYFTVGGMTQDLVWEQYPYPVELKRVLAGNSSTVVTEPTATTELREPLPPQADVLINKTGSTNGFGAYVAFVPARKLGVVILANKRYDIAARVTAAYKILTRLDRPFSR